MAFPRGITRRHALISGAAAGVAAAIADTPLFAAPASANPASAKEAGASPTVSHGLSTFGELQLPPDFKHYAYVNPDAPKGGILRIWVTNGPVNASLQTFDTLHTFILRGAGAAGMDSTFDALMSGHGDEPTALYGLVAHKVEISPDKLTYRFFMRPEARFHDGSKLTAHDAAFSFNVLKQKGHPVYKILLRDFVSAEAEEDHILRVRFAPKRTRDVHLYVATLPIFSKKWWEGRDFSEPTMDEPLGSGAYKLKSFRAGRNLIFERVKDYWAKDLPVNAGINNFDEIRYEYFRERQIAFEAFKSGALNFREEYTSRLWHTAYNFPAIDEGKVKKEEIRDGAPVPTQGWYFNTRRKQFKDPRIREALAYCFDFEWTNRNIMYSTYKRLESFFENTDMKATGKPSPAELKLLEKWKGKVSPEVFGEPWAPPKSDGSGSDRALLRKANSLLMAAGCKRQGRTLVLPDGSPLTFKFLDSSGTLKPHTEPFQANLRRLGIQTTYEIVDAAQYKRRLDDFDFDVMVMAMGGTLTPGDGLRNVYSSQAAKTSGTRNMAGISDPVIDELIEIIAQAKSRDELNTAARVLDRVLRAGRYWIPMWYKNTDLIAYWDVFSRPDKTPKYGTGAPGTWWWDNKKATAIGKAE